MQNRRYFDKLQFKMRRNTILDEKLLPTEKSNQAISTDKLNLTKTEFNIPALNVSRYISTDDYREIMLKSNQSKHLIYNYTSNKPNLLNQSSGFESIYMSPERTKHMTNLKKLKESLNATISNIQKLKKSRSRSQSFERDTFERSSYVNVKLIPDSKLFVSTTDQLDTREVEKEVQNLVRIYHTNIQGFKAMNNKYKLDLGGVIDKEKTFTKYCINKNIDRSERDLIKKTLKQSFYNERLKATNDSSLPLLTDHNIDRNQSFARSNRLSPIKVIKDEVYFDNPFTSYKTLKINKQIVENVQELLTKKQIKEYLNKIDKIEEFKEKLKYMKDIKITNAPKVFENRKNAIKTESLDLPLASSEATTIIQDVWKLT